ncbi:MAG: ABC transporter permease [Candidatus Doudnabacteria bacterium]|nr:ABC transporter permease [Candidatus Doudnabacteria bacterium]
MSWSRVYAIILRYSYLLFRNPDRAADTFYWPTIDLFVWGLTGLYVEGLAGNLLIINIIISGIIFYHIIFRTQGEVSVNLLEEYWSHNLVNIFVSPLRLSEWLIAVVVNGIIKGLLGFVFTGLVALFLYKIAVFSYGFYLIPFIFSLMLTGWFMGFFIAGIVFRYGTKIQFMAWTFTSLFAPFSAIYYPVTFLPVWAQKVAAILPTSYVFEGLREVIHTGHFDPNKFWISLLLNLFYLSLSIVYIRSSFRKALDRGLINTY